MSGIAIHLPFLKPYMKVREHKLRAYEILRDPLEPKSMGNKRLEKFT
jgi:hypothetical protein